MRTLALAAFAGLTLVTTMAAPAAAQDWRHDRREWRDDRRDWRDDRRDWRDDRRDWRDDRRDWRDARWDNRRDWRWDGNRYRDAYYHPRGYAYRPYAIGYPVPRPYIGGRYWINDWGRYRLPPPWAGTRWVRVGPDALLIRIGDGFVLRAVRGLWW